MTRQQNGDHARAHWQQPQHGHAHEPSRRHSFTGVQPGLEHRLPFKNSFYQFLIPSRYTAASTSTLVNTPVSTTLVNSPTASQVRAAMDWGVAAGLPPNLRSSKDFGDECRHDSSSPQSMVPFSSSNFSESEQALTSRAMLTAAGRRRTKAAMYGCSFCPQKLTSRDNLIS